MGILSRKAIEQFKKGGFVGENVISDLEDTALALYDENEKMKGEIENLIDKIKNRVTREDEILQDLASIGKEENGNIKI